MDCKVFILLNVILLIYQVSCESEPKLWSWGESDDEKINVKREATDTGNRQARVMNRNDEEFLALPSIEQQRITEFHTNATEATFDEVVDEIIRSGRQGRNLEGLDEVYADPIVKQALDSGDDTHARNLIRDKLCSLGLMQCDELIAKRPPTRILYSNQPPNYNSNVRPVYRPPPGKGPYGPPQPVPYNPNGPPRKVGYAGPNYQNKPNSRPAFEKYDHTGFGFEQQQSQSANSGVRFGYTEKPTIVVNQSPKQEAAASNVQIHHHYHHVDGTAAQEPPKTIVVNNPIPVQPILTTGHSNSHTSEYSGYNNLNSYQNGASGTSGFGSDSGFVPSSEYDYKGVNSGHGSSGLYTSQTSVKPVFESNQYASQFNQGNGNGNFGGPTQAAFNELGGNSLYSQQGYQGSFHSSAPDFYKKELNINGPTKTNGLNQYSNQNLYSNQQKYSQSQYNQGERYQGSESARQDQFDCTCVPYSQCSAADIVGRRDDLILPLDPRNLPTDIEADDSNSTHIEKDHLSQNSTVKAADKKVAKREVAGDSQKAQGEGRILGFGGGGNYGPGYGQGGGKKVLPTLGVSFGLPFPGGYPVNPYGHPYAPNPYFGGIGPNGLNLGLLNVNPLVSLQVTKNEHGEKLVKPLVNLHVTPNAGIIKAVGGLFAHKKQALHNHYHHHSHRYPPPPPHLHYAAGYGYENQVPFHPPHGHEFHGPPDFHGPPTGPGFHGPPDFHGPPTGPGFHGPPTGPGFHGPPTGPGFHGPPDFHGPPTGPGFHGPPTGPGFHSPPDFHSHAHTGPGGFHGPISDKPIFGPPVPFFKDNSPIGPDYDNFAADFNPELNSYRNLNSSVDDQELQQLKRNYNQNVYPQNAPGTARGSKTVTFPNNRRKRDTDQIVPDSIDSESNVKETLASVHDSDDDDTEGRAITAGKRQAFYQGQPQYQKLKQCGPQQVCCRRSLANRAPHQIPQQQQKRPRCGVRNAQGINGRIKNPVYVDGDSEFGEYPWQAAILKKDAKESVYVCGGTLIDNQHILTAAHCVKTYSGFDLRVRVGEWDVNHDVEFFPYIERDVISVHIHPEYYAGTLDNDLAILKLTQPVDIVNAPHITPACMPDKFTDYAGARCWTTGWGKDSWDYGKYQNILKEVDVPIIGHRQCEAQLQQTRLGYEYKLNPGFLCAGGEEGKDACKGDGGGPLVCERNGVWQVVGIVSWGIGCGQANVPGVYVKVAHYLDWIQQITQRF